MNMRLAETYVAVILLVKQNETTSKMASRRQECTICLDSFKNPKLIPCHHSFCCKCLEDYVQANLRNGRFDCPMCRKSVELPPGGVSSFQGNYYIDSDSGENFPCDICGPKSVARSRCLDCEENLCQSCCYGHERSKASRHHKICDLGTLEPEMKGRIRQRIFCDQHPEEEIKLVCKDCKALICVLCKAGKHDHHATEAVSDAAAEVKKTIQVKMRQCSDKVRRITVSVQEADAQDRKIDDAERKEIKALEDQRLQLIKIIDQEVAKMKDKIQNVYKDLRKQNAALRRVIKEELKTCSTANENVSKLIDQGTDIDIIKKSPDVEQLLSTAMSETAQKPMRKMEKDLFLPVEIKLSEIIPLIGMMRDSTELSPEERREQEEREKKEREEIEKRQREEREKKEREEMLRKEREERKKKEVDEREKKEKEEREKKEREEKQIQACRSSGYRPWAGTSISDETLKSWMCPRCQGWLPDLCTFLLNRCQCGANK